MALVWKADYTVAKGELVNSKINLKKLFRMWQTKCKVKRHEWYNKENKDRRETIGERWLWRLMTQMFPKLWSQQCSDSESEAQLKPYLHLSWQTSKHQRQEKGLKSNQR